MGFDKQLCNCTYTTDDGEDVRVSISALIEVMNSIPKRPRILTMPIQLKEHPLLLDNTILISSDIAKALEQALRGGE